MSFSMQYFQMIVLILVIIRHAVMHDTTCPAKLDDLVCDSYNMARHPSGHSWILPPYDDGIPDWAGTVLAGKADREPPYYVERCMEHGAICGTLLGCRWLSHGWSNNMLSRSQTHEQCLWPGPFCNFNNIVYRSAETDFSSPSQHLYKITKSCYVTGEYETVDANSQAQVQLNYTSGPILTMQPTRADEVTECVYIMYNPLGNAINSLSHQIDTDISEPDGHGYAEQTVLHFRDKLYVTLSPKSTPKYMIYTDVIDSVGHITAVNPYVLQCLLVTTQTHTWHKRSTVYAPGPDDGAKSITRTPLLIPYIDDDVRKYGEITNDPLEIYLRTIPTTSHRVMGNTNGGTHHLWRGLWSCARRQYICLSHVYTVHKLEHYNEFVLHKYLSNDNLSYRNQYAISLFFLNVCLINSRVRKDESIYNPHLMCLMCVSCVNLYCSFKIETHEKSLSSYNYNLHTSD